MSHLYRAIRIAVDAHEGQADKAGEPYILHPLRVMLAMSGETDRIVAVLHDVAEDSANGWRDIHEAGFSSEIIDAVDSVTRREGESYSAFIARAGANAIGRRVKIADLKDNLRGIHGNRERYRKALLALGEKLDHPPTQE